MLSNVLDCDVLHDHFPWQVDDAKLCVEALRVLYSTLYSPVERVARVELAVLLKLSSAILNASWRSVK